ncbi:hypothetical protein AVEN_135123-1 [Araneus ventricosus]|uniref:HTH psq-type domain-containing protein n=1 Tax=Araneus ventricosus TaxID=182803 RepID=A0A4Y2HGK6_ARAVE|nr:hypothetical protein AVEN_135123-1 [Araneus ventricosus]
MVRKRTTDRASTSLDFTAEVIKTVSHKDLPYSKVAKKYGISLHSQKRYCQKASKAGITSSMTYKLPTNKQKFLLSGRSLGIRKTDVRCLFWSRHD